MLSVVIFVLPFWQWETLSEPTYRQTDSALIIMGYLSSLIYDDSRICTAIKQTCKCNKYTLCCIQLLLWILRDDTYDKVLVYNEFDELNVVVICWSQVLLASIVPFLRIRLPLCWSWLASQCARWESKNATQSDSSLTISTLFLQSFAKLYVCKSRCLATASCSVLFFSRFIYILLSHFAYVLRTWSV